MIEKINHGKNFQNAFKCDACPQSYEEDGCPAWMVYDEIHTDGMRREVSGCGIAIIPHLLLQNMRASDRATETFDKTNRKVGILCRLFVEIIPELGIDPRRIIELIPVKEVLDALPASCEQPDVGDGKRPPSGGDS